VLDLEHGIDGINDADGLCRDHYVESLGHQWQEMGHGLVLTQTASPQHVGRLVDSAQQLGKAHVAARAQRIALCQRRNRHPLGKPRRGGTEPLVAGFTNEALLQRPGFQSFDVL
jgi:hypothetical protein